MSPHILDLGLYHYKIKLASALSELKKFKEAIQMCNKAIELDPLQVDAYLIKG